MILLIDTSTNVCSVAVCNGMNVLAHEELMGENAPHASNLTLMIERVVAQAGKTMNDIEAVALGEGPGSYTGLRIGASTAKGICYALSVPMIAISTLEIMAEQMFAQNPAAQTVAPMIDARRMEVYTAVYNRDKGCLAEPCALVVDESAYQRFLAMGDVYFGGDGADKCKSVINSESAHFIDDINPLACNMARLASRKFANEEFVDVAYFEPFYLKEYVAVISQNKALRGLTK